MARPGPALFELIRGGNAPPVPARSVPTGKPLVKVTLKAPAAAEPPIPAAADKPSEKAWASWTGKQSLRKLSEPLTVRTSTVLIAIGVAVVVLVITWAIGYTVGSRGGEERAKRDLGPAVKPETVPLNTNLITGPAAAPEPKPVVERKVTQPGTTPTSPAVAAGSDPRVAGLNYLLLASGLDREGAERMVQFLAQNGLPAAAAVDKPASGSNNRGSFIVFALKGITPEEYKNRSASRLEVDGAAARVGKLWAKDKKGQTDFSQQAYWKKFAG